MGFVWRISNACARGSGAHPPRRHAERLFDPRSHRRCLRAHRSDRTKLVALDGAQHGTFGCQLAQYYTPDDVHLPNLARRAMPEASCHDSMVSASMAPRTGARCPSKPPTFAVV